MNLLHFSPEDRICDFQEIKSSGWLKDINWKEMESKSNALNYYQHTTLKYAPDLYGNYIA